MRLFQKAAALFAAIILSVVFSACQNTVKPPREEPLKRPGDSFLKYGDTNETIIELSKVNSSVWVHTSYHEENGELIPVNGLLTVTDTGLVLIDTPWTEKQLESLDKLVHEAFNGSLKGAVITCANPARMNALSYLKKSGIPVYSLQAVADEAQKNGFALPGQVYEGDSASLEIDKTMFELFHPGKGYTPESTVVWLEKYKLLYAGGLVLEYGAVLPHELAKEDIDQWSASLKSVRDRYPEIEIAVPRQGQWGDISLIDYTMELLEE